MTHVKALEKKKKFGMYHIQMRRHSALLKKPLLFVQDTPGARRTEKEKHVSGVRTRGALC